MIAIFLFYNKAHHKISYLSTKHFRHCDIFTFDGQYWIHSSLTLDGIRQRVYPNQPGGKLLAKLQRIASLTALVSIYVDKKKVLPWKPVMIWSCNELTRYISGVDLGFSLTPRDLYNKLLKYGNSRNYEILSVWERDGTSNDTRP